MIPSAVACVCTERTTLQDAVDRARRERLVQLRDEEARLVGPAREAEQREREEEQRHEREEREVRDHRREMRAAVGEELRKDLSHRAGG